MGLAEPMPSCHAASVWRAFSIWRIRVLKRFCCGVSAGAGFAGRDLQGLGAHRAEAGSTTEDRIADERLRVNVPKRAVPLRRQMTLLEIGL
ncbi:hypothetical protein D9M72_568210 [compost metagenome]